MCGLRNAMSGVITKATDWEIIPRTFANPIQWVKLPKKWEVFEKRILSPEQTAQVMARLEEPNLLICETCLDTGTRISEVTGLMIKHVVLDKGIIRIEQRHCRGDIDVPKTAKSKRTLTLGGLTARYKDWIEGLRRKGPNDWVFPQDEDLARPGGTRASGRLSRRRRGRSARTARPRRTVASTSPALDRTPCAAPTSRGGRRSAAAASRRARSRATRAQPLRRSTRSWD
jgi:integrase